MKDLDKIREDIHILRNTDLIPDDQINVITSILFDLVDHLEKSEQNVNRVSNEASCLANGIKPD